MKRTIRKMYFRSVDFIESIVSSKKTIIIALVVLSVVVIGSFVGYKALKPQPKKVYEALIQVRSQSNPDPAEDVKTSLKAGDVLVVLPEGHNWSQTERVSYLILKMNLTEEQARKLLEPEEKVEMVNLPKEEIEQAKKEGQKIEKEREQRTTLRTRRYRIMIEEIDPSFDPNVLLERQPFLDKTYDWKIVEKKPKV